MKLDAFSSGWNRLKESLSKITSESCEQATIASSAREPRLEKTTQRQTSILARPPGVALRGTTIQIDTGEQAPFWFSSV
jgi:hypothetical protein